MVDWPIISLDRKSSLVLKVLIHVYIITATSYPRTLSILCVSTLLFIRGNRERYRADDGTSERARNLSHQPLLEWPYWPPWCSADSKSTPTQIANSGSLSVLNGRHYHAKNCGWPKHIAIEYRLVNLFGMRRKIPVSRKKHGSSKSSDIWTDISIGCRKFKHLNKLLCVAEYQRMSWVISRLLQIKSHQVGLFEANRLYQAQTVGAKDFCSESSCVRRASIRTCRTNFWTFWRRSQGSRWKNWWRSRSIRKTYRWTGTPHAGFSVQTRLRGQLCNRRYARPSHTMELVERRRWIRTRRFESTSYSRQISLRGKRRHSLYHE